ncbi:MAG: ABC transporter permease [Lachnospiraceae bacterium]|nr:ABC transporter permease [Lachnospiraceae bacterium]
MDKYYERIPQEMFEFAQLDSEIHDEKFKTKARGFFADAMLRFKKNKSSVVAAYIIGFLILFAIVSPLISENVFHYTIEDKDNVYINAAPYIPSIAAKEWGIWDGSMTMNSQSQLQLDMLYAIGQETGLNPVIGEPVATEREEMYRGKPRKVYSYAVKVNTYYKVGVKNMVMSYSEFENIQKWQNETGVQVIFPAVDKRDIYPSKIKDLSSIADNPNIWYQCTDNKNTPKTDSNGNLVPAYCTDKEKEGAPYNSIRIEGDNGDYIYSIAKSGSVLVRVCYYNYFWYTHDSEPNFILGTDTYGRDLFCAIGKGARFSLIFALFVSIINLSIGAFAGAYQGYYGGWVDLICQRLMEILSGMPFIVVTTLFQLYMAAKVGVVGAFLFAFVLTGWIGMANLTRKQFYRFKGQEYVLAARTLGASDKRIMFKHIFPNALGTIITSCALVIPGVISSETSLTYLGIVDLSKFSGTSIGELMKNGQQTMTTSPHAMLYPSIFFSLLMISFNLFGNGLRDAFNPSTRGTED